MRTVDLTPNIQDTRTAIERTEESAIAGEIAAHLLEFADRSTKTKALQFILKLASIGREDPSALWIVLRVMSGDLHELTRSYAEQGKLDARSKQACQQEMERALRTLDRTYPEVARVVHNLRRITADWKEAKPTP